MLGTERHAPQNKNREKGTWQSPSPNPRKEAPPPGHLTQIFLRQLSSAQLSLDNLLEALACRVPSLYGFCNKVLIHVNLCGDYCVQQYFLVYLFFLCDVSLLFFYL